MKRAVLLLLALFGCYTPPQKVTLRVEVPPELADDAKAMQVLPRVAELRRSVARGTVQLELQQIAGKIRLDLPGACPAVVDTRRLPNAAVRLESLFDVGPPERVVGLGTPFVVVATPRCAEARATKTRFAVVGGAPLDNVQSDARRFSATTTSSLGLQPTPGIVPVSAFAAARLRTELRFQATLQNGASTERALGISAVARSSGLPDVGLNHPALLSGDGWTLQQAPHDSHAALRRIGDVWELTPDAAGRYTLTAPGRSLSLHSGRFDQMPLDCGRANCHVEIAKNVHESPMTKVLASDLGGCHSLSRPECASACHATGEPGTADGGFTQVLAELALPALPAEYEDLPVALQRLGGVGCLACHGPTKIPEPAARSSIVKSAVCAVCHDAPPRYGHVQALGTSRMAHADSSADSRQQPCARCHTSWGALGRPAPAEDGASGGIGCAVCHDVHPHGPQPPAAPAGLPAESGLLRRMPLPATLSDVPPSFYGPSRVCIGCHAPSSASARPEASAAAILAGQGGLEPKTGVALRAAAPPTNNPKGCLQCHNSGPEALVLGKHHAFRADATTYPRDPTLAERARRLVDRLEPSGPSRHRAARPLPTDPIRARALYDALLVAEDPAADVHHPAYAKALLDAAETGVGP